MMARQPLLAASFKGTFFDYRTLHPSLHSMICSSGSQAFFRQAHIVGINLVNQLKIKLLVLGRHARLHLVWISNSISGTETRSIITKTIRSKNAGVDEIIFDVVFTDRRIYEAVRDRDQVHHPLRPLLRQSGQP